jgi:hypothetical protein
VAESLAKVIQADRRLASRAARLFAAWLGKDMTKPVIATKMLTIEIAITIVPPYDVRARVASSVDLSSKNRKHWRTGADIDAPRFSVNTSA